MHKNQRNPFFEKLIRSKNHFSPSKIKISQFCTSKRKWNNSMVFGFQLSKSKIFQKTILCHHVQVRKNYTVLLTKRSKLKKKQTVLSDFRTFLKNIVTFRKIVFGSRKKKIRQKKITNIRLKQLFPSTFECYQHTYNVQKKLFLAII